MASRQPIKSPAYLWQNRHGIYFFRARIPLPFQDHFGKVEFKRTLKTDSRREAIKLARAYRVKMDKELDKLKGIYSAYEVTLEAKTPHPTKQGEFITSKITRPLSTPTEDTYPLKKQLLEQTREEALFQAKLENTNSQPQSEIETPSPVLSEVIKLYIDEGETLKRWSDKTQHQIETTLKLLVKIAGDMSIGAFNKSHARDFKQKFITLPSNMNKKREYREKSIDELLKMDIPKDHLQAHNTIDNNLVRISTFFKWTEDSGYTDKNYFSGMTIGKSKRASEERKTFSPDDLKKLFESAEYQKGFREPFQYWVPLIALYTGTRLEEICRLRVESFNVVDGINVIQITPDGDWGGKTKAALRTIPIHSKLIELGLLEYVDNQKSRSHTRLFPELTKQRDGYGARVSKWFTRYRKKCGITESGKVFHSFRHTLTDELKQAGVSLEVAKAIIGHEDESETFGRYGKSYRANILHKAIELVDYGLTHSTFKFKGK